MRAENIAIKENDKDTPLYSISSAARLLNISVHTLRMYEREGLIVPYKKDSNHRLYSESDIDRLKCIRTSIKEKKFTIPSINALYSMLPCWAIINCSEEERENCSAFINSDKPCWAYKHLDNVCSSNNCRTCEVYTQYTDCSMIKSKIKELTIK